MPKLLSQLLNSQGPLFDSLIADLEKATRNQFIDVDIVGKVMTKSNAKLRELGFVPGDILIEELRLGLLSKYKDTADTYRYAIVGENSNSNFLLRQIYSEYKSILDFEVLGLNKKSIINIIKDNPPVKMLESLSIKSEDLLLKKFKPAQILYVARQTEGDKWRRFFNAKLLNLKPDDFSLSRFELMLMDDKLENLLKLHHKSKDFIADGLSGCIYVNRASSLTDDPLAYSLSLLIEARDAIDVSNQLQIMALSKDFGKKLSSLASGKQAMVWQLFGVPVPWRSIYRAFAQKKSKLNKLLAKEFPELKLKEFDIVSELNSSFNGFEFWSDSSATALKIEDKILSMNLIDVAFRLDNYPTRHISGNYYFEETLWDWLLKQYLNDENLASQIILQLKGEIINN